MKYEDLIVYKTEKHANNFINRIGYENDYFKVVSEAPPLNGRVRWNCLCKACGQYCVKDFSNLNKHKSCGCQKKAAIGKALRKDLTNKRFGMLTAIKYSGRSNVSGNAIWECKCDCGTITYVDSNNLTSLHTLSCGCINSSIGEDNIVKVLKNNNISYLREYPLKEIKDVNPFRLDFVILDDKNNIIRAIEYDGIQHYKETWGAWSRNITLEQQQERDKRKNEWCLNNNIPLVRIPYWERDNINLEMLLGNTYLV